MTPRQLAELIVLAALWGGSFLFMRIAAPQFGPVPLIALRVGIATLVLLPLLAWRGRIAALGRRAGMLFLLGVVNSAVPFSLLAYATLSVTAGFAAVLNATAPLFTAFVAWIWLKDRLSPSRALGLVIGFAGVVVLVMGKASFKPGGSGLAVLAALGATFLYGVAANLTKRSLTGVDSLSIATGSLAGATIALLPLAVWQWPHVPPRPDGWVAVLLLAVACTALAYILYFRLIAELGPAKAIAVTYLIPLFGILWGAIWLGEKVTANMVAGGAVILLGTALATGVVGPRLLRRAALTDGAGAESAEPRTSA